jgi:enamine deaminase RidA (YjgF/YER057c/UK114 family)
MQDMLEYCNFNPEQIIRTWIYQGQLTELDREPGKEASAEPQAVPQRYQELNRARTDFFQPMAMLADLLPREAPLLEGRTAYPASTGIGSSDDDIIMGCLAVQKKRPDVFAVPLENPLQTSAFAYSEHYSPTSPKFARALALVDGDLCTVFVSGTASITDSETQHSDDPAAQTEQTLDLIGALIARANLTQHGITGQEATLADLVVARVYIKHQADYELVRKICERRCPNVPTTYVVADVCRDDLLVEIEGIAVARHI